MQKPFSVTAHLSTPFVTGGGYMTLDGLLAARLFEELHDVEAAHAAVLSKWKPGLPVQAVRSTSRCLWIESRSSHNFEQGIP
jgi:hypothetical protein